MYPLFDLFKFIHVSELPNCYSLLYFSIHFSDVLSLVLLPLLSHCY